MSHFTYKLPEKSVLKQGDILFKGDEIISILNQVHPHYLKDDYKYFIVLTQTCDLVRRKEKCKSRYITIAAVRPLNLLLEREIKKQQKTLLEAKSGICNADKKNTLYNFLERLFNNNEPEYFYLSDDTSLNFPEKMVAFLRLSISIKSDLHYKSCLDSKLLELTDTFKAKLGWLVGNMYSRVGTPDWVPNAATKMEFNKMINDILNENVAWVHKKVINNIIDDYKDKISNMTSDKIREIAINMKLKKDWDEVLEKIEKIIIDSGYIDNRKIVTNIIRRISNDPLLKQKFG